MMSSRTVFEGKARVRLIDRPVQPPSHHLRLRTYVAGGPDEVGDRRLYLSVEELEQLLGVARSSELRRVVVHYAGVRVDEYEDTTDAGHRWEVWHLLGGHLEPEQLPVGLGSPL